MIAFIVVLSTLLIGLRLVRGGEPAEIRLVKTACGFDKDENGKWTIDDVKTEFPNIEWWVLEDSEEQDLYDAYVFLAEEAIVATRAAHMNPIWRSLADAKTEAMNNLLFAYVLDKGRNNETALYDLAPSLNSSLNRSNVECAALRDELNS
jgi:hypothetical protein